MKRVISLILALSMVLSFAACSKNVKEDDSPITMYVGLGNTNSGYYENLKNAIKNELGYDIQFVYSNTSDTTNAMNMMIKNNDLPADIIVTASRTVDEYQQKSFLDLSVNTNIPDLFTTNQLSQVAIDGSVYQLPFATRLIGITYNKTLFEEYNLDVPTNFEDMVALKEQADSLGLKFSVSGGAATGHGFNYLFNLMGTEYIFGAKGTEWLAKYRSGEAEVDDFKSASSYFEKFKEAGLFGSFHDQDWNANIEFMETRALFYINYINDTYSYDGFQYDDEGKIVGATYDGENIVVEEAKDGIAVDVGGKYVLYDENNEAHKGLARYNIPGATVLHDKYASMPWISKSGNSNCFVTYNNMYLAVNKEMGESENADKFAKIIDILEFMTTEKATKIFTDLYQDGYVGVKDFKIDDTRLYAGYTDSVNKGYLMPWYYNEFDNDSIVGVGQVVNDYIKGNDTFENIFVELDKDNTAHVNHTSKVSAKITETLCYEYVAKLQCVANGISAQKALDDNGIDAKVTVSILPYTDDINKLPIEIRIPVVQAKMYKGDFETSLFNSTVQGYTNAPIIVKMSGKAINDLVTNGYNTKYEFDVDQKFDVAVMTKGNIEIKDSEDYYVVIPSQVLCEKYEEYQSIGAVISVDGTELTGLTTDGLTMYFENHSTVSKSNIEWK